MTSTILPRKAQFEWPTATDDDHFYAMTKDPALSQFPPGSNYEQFNKNYYNLSGNSTQNINQSISNTPVLTGASSTNAASGADVLVSNDNVDWVNKKWRPAMGWMYMIVCVTDFIIFPILWSILQAVFRGNVSNPWQPLTLQGAGLFHIAMGAVLGIAAYGRTKEKVEGATK